MVSVANIIDALHEIDFQSLFYDHDSALYRDLRNASVIDHLTEYIGRITSPPFQVATLALQRVDAQEMLDGVISTIYPLETQDGRGKVTTDSELASLLAVLSITEPVSAVIDPCCGDGMLISAAYDRLIQLGMSHENALAAVRGIEIDPVALRMSALRLALKQPAIVSPSSKVLLIHGDMFANPEVLRSADIVLMNPPFKRYEAQDDRPVPRELRTYFSQKIEQISGQAARTTAGQANLFNFYVEYVATVVENETRLAIILDNRWYHSRSGMELRKLLLETFQIEAIIEYPHSTFFADFTIATSIVIARKVATVRVDHAVKFIRSRVDPRGTDLSSIALAFQNAGEWPLDWTCQKKLQTELVAEVGWKRFFAADLLQEFRRSDLPTLNNLFERVRRGSLEKEGGGISVFEFPFRRSDYGPSRLPSIGGGNSFQTRKDRELTSDENELLSSLANQIPQAYRGYAIRNSDTTRSYELTTDDVTYHQILEPPALRTEHETFFSVERTAWTEQHEIALEEMRQDAHVGAYIRAIEHIVNLTETVLPREKLWIALREPYAGELIIPRKTRQGHRVHINPLAFDSSSRQVRISSNFVTYGGCKAIDTSTGLDRATSTRLIAAFLVSSFGQLQFEIEGYNREGLLALEKTQLNRIRVFDPRWIHIDRRQAILNAFVHLPYPIPTDRFSRSQPERNELDLLFAAEFSARYTDLNAEALLEEVHTALDQWLSARQP